MLTKIKVKIGLVEIECEGEENFVQKEFLPLITSIVKLQKDLGPIQAPTNQAQNNANGQSSGSATIDGTLTVSAAAKKLAVKTGPELAIAAAATLTFAKGKSGFSRAELLEEMKGADGVYKDTYRKNLSGTLTSLVKDDRFRKAGANQFSLSMTTRTELESKLGSAG